MAPPPGAAALSVTVQVLLSPAASEAGLQVKPEIVAGATRLSEKFNVLPLRLAVTSAVELEVRADADAVKLAVVEPDGTVTVAGTAKEALLLARVTAAPPLGAAALSVTVHVLLALDPSVEGLHTRFDSTAGAARVSE